MEDKKSELAQIQNRLSSKLQVWLFPCFPLERFTKPDLMGQIQGRIASLQKLSEQLKTQYLNQEIPASVGSLDEM